MKESKNRIDRVSEVLFWIATLLFAGIVGCFLLAGFGTTSAESAAKAIVPVVEWIFPAYAISAILCCLLFWGRRSRGNKVFGLLHVLVINLITLWWILENY
jgi:hypothetical protein